MEHELNRSVRMLEEALSVQGKSLLRTGTPKKTKQASQKKYHCLKDLSVTLAADEMSLLTGGEFTMFDETLNNVLQNRTLTGTVITQSQPWENCIDALFIEYLEVIQARTSIHEIFDTVSDLARCCGDTLNVVKSLKEKVNIKKADDLQWLVNERNTWRLIYCLYQDRLNVQNSEEDLPYFGINEKLCIENLYKRDSLVRETQLVIDWLECSAADQEEILTKIEHFTDKTIGWENTVHQLQSEDTIVFKSTRPIITEMDLDAPLRENLPLHDLDIEDEERLFKKLFTYIRCGKLQEAQNLSMHCGQAWISGMLEGWKLYQDPNPNQKSNDSKITGKLVRPHHEGNMNRDIWKLFAWQYCQEFEQNKYERALVAAFCGCLPTLLPVCPTWEDQLWAHLRTVVDIRVESEIRDYVSREYEELPTEYWNNRMSLDEVFERLTSSTSASVRDEATAPDHLIQKYLILDQIPQLMISIDQWLCSMNVTSHFLRFLAHLVLFLKQIGHSQKDDIADKVLEEYVKCLIEMNEPQLIAYYTATLGQQKQLELYSTFLEKISGNTERQDALQFGEDAGLNIKAITKHVVEKILNRVDKNVSITSLQRTLTNDDLIKISALDWVLFYPSQRAEAINQSNNLVSYFLTLGKIEGAKQAFGKIPVNAIDTILSENEEEIPEYVHRWIKEHLSYKAYLDAHEAFNDWFKYYHHSKPIKPADLSENATFTEKVAHEHKVSQHRAECERWKLTVSHLCKTTKTLLYNVLLFPDGGWLNGTDNAEHLRSTCIPETFLLLYTVLSKSEEHEECLRLADILAAEKYELYKVFSKDKLEDILQKFFETTISLLDEKKDMWAGTTIN